MKIALQSCLASFSEEVAAALTEQGEEDLAVQIPELDIVGRCGCGQADCSTIQVRHRTEHNASQMKILISPQKSHRCVPIDDIKGMVVLDLDVEGFIIQIEIPGRGDVRAALRDAGVE